MKPQISVVIPCYNHARYVGEAIDSVLLQELEHEVEIIVVDDGSPDNTAEVVSRYPQVKYFKQENQGLSAARNAGLHQSSGEYVVFLDADDRLLPGALQHGLNCACEHPDAAFVSGHVRYIDGEGTVIAEYPPEPISSEPYLALLQRNYIENPAAVLYQRSAIEGVGGFDRSLRSCEDYDLYLRIARNSPVYRHEHMVVEYRWHGGNMSSNSFIMLESALAVLRRQQSHVSSNVRYLAACRTGVRFWRGYFFGMSWERFVGNSRARRRTAVVYSLLDLINYARPYLKALTMDVHLTAELRRRRRKEQ